MHFSRQSAQPPTFRSFSTNIFGCLIISAFPLFGFAEEVAKPETATLYTSLSGALRIEKTTESTKDGEPATSVWVISIQDPTQRAKIPKESSDPMLDDDEFHCSPNVRGHELLVANE